MKIAVRGGHNYLATGTESIINEVKEDRLVYPSVIKYLKNLGHSVLDVTPGNLEENPDLVYGVNKANNWGADLFVSIHFNNVDNEKVQRAIGSEVCAIREFPEAKRVVDSLGSLGFINRGIKIRPNLYEIKYTDMKAMIIEVCFVESRADVGLYKKLGYDKIGKTIAEAISNKKVSGGSSSNKPTESGNYKTVTASVLNVRSGSGTNFKVIGTLKKGEKVKVDNKSGNWYSIFYGDHGGWVSADYLK